MLTAIVIRIFDKDISPAGVFFVKVSDDFDLVRVNGAACHALRINLFVRQHIVKRQKLLIVGTVKPL